MFIDARQLSESAVLETDLCIVGGGAAGITIANALRDARFRILLLESGGLEIEDATQALYAGEMRGVPNENVEATRLRFFGGTTNHWAGWCRPLDDDDFSPAGEPSIRAWPIARADLDPFYEKAQSLVELGPYAYDTLEPWLRECGLTAPALDPRKLKTALFQISPPTRFGSAFHDALKQAGNVTVMLHANAIEIQAEPGGGRVTGVHGQCLGGPSFTVKARVVVLAAGGLENARLLLASNSVQTVGLGNGHDAVGRYFMDHPWLTDAGFAAFSVPGEALRFYWDQIATRGTTIFGTFVPGAPEPGIGKFRVWMRPRHRIVEGVDALKKLGGAALLGHLPDDGFWHTLGLVLADYDAVADSLYRTAFRTKTSPFAVADDGNSPVVGAYLDANVEQFPDPASRIVLSDKRDALGQNRLAMDWRPGTAERRTIRRAIEHVADEFGRLGLGRVRIRDVPENGPWPDGMTGSRHHLGTTRMSANPRTGVVDATCRVHGIANLYAAGSSVFASSGYANPTLTIVALALRLADELRRQIV